MIAIEHVLATLDEYLGAREKRHELDDVHPGFASDIGERPQKLCRVGTVDEPHVDRRRIVIVEKMSRRNLEYRRDPLNPGSANPVRTALVFLDLLERDADLVGQFRLRKLEHQSSGTNARTDFPIAVGH